MFAPSINVDLEKLQQAAEEQPAPRRKVAARGRKTTQQPARAEEVQQPEA